MQGKCVNPKGCECDQSKNRHRSHQDLRFLCNYWERPEEAMDALDHWSISNFQRLPEDQREACIKVLLRRVPADVMARWKDQATRGMRIGSEQGRFHMTIGMAVRNTLRSVLKDDQLPLVEYSDGRMFQNWDDFYIGAMQAAAAA